MPDLPNCPVCGGEMRSPDGEFVIHVRANGCMYGNTLADHIAIYALVEKGRSYSAAKLDNLSAAILMIGSELQGNPGMDPNDTTDPRWTPTLSAADRVVAERDQAIRGRDEAQKAREQIEAEWLRFCHAPELEWLQVGTPILQALAALAQTNKRLADIAKAAYDAGNKYVNRVLRERDEARDVAQEARYLLTHLMDLTASVDGGEAWLTRRDAWLAAMGRG